MIIIIFFATHSSLVTIALVGAEICRILRDMKAVALQRLVPDPSLVELTPKCWRLELTDSLLCATSTSLEKHGATHTIHTVLALLMKATPAAP